MKFPIINVSIKQWTDSQDLAEYTSYDKYIYTNKDSIFDQFYKDQLFCDCNGSIFRAVSKTELREKWRNWFKFIPNVWKTEIIFIPTGEIMNLEELREYYLTRISELKKTDFVEEWISNIKVANTYFELIHGK
jgi:hypothetical protein